MRSSQICINLLLPTSCWGYLLVLYNFYVFTLMQGLHNYSTTSRLIILIVFSNVVVVEVVLEIIKLVRLNSEFLLLSLESEEKQAFYWSSLIVISMLSVSLDFSTTLAFDIYPSCLCQSFIWGFLLHRYTGLFFPFINIVLLS